MAGDMSQLVVIEGDAVPRPEQFPQQASGGAVLDVNKQQLDLRSQNSWLLKLEDVSTGEMAEVNNQILIQQVIPYAG